IKTIGDAYMVVGGLPEPRPDHAQAVAAMALEMQQEIDHLRRDTGEPLRLRIGIHSGPVVARVIGERKFSYGRWGEAVNLASRMESHGVPGRIQVTAAARARLEDAFTFVERGTIDVRGFGPMPVFFLEGAREAALLQAISNPGEPVSPDEDPS